MKGDSILGIDPGKTGGFVLLSPGGSILRKFTMPLDKEDQIDLYALGLLFYEMSDLIRTAYLEKVQGVFFRNGKIQSGGSGVFGFGKNYGIVIGQLSAFRIPFEFVRPQEWQKRMHIGVHAEEAKVKSALAVLKIFPKEDFRANHRCRKPHDGLVDAALIAEYGRQITCGPTI